MRLDLSYNNKDLGVIKFSYDKGKVMGRNEGLIVRTSIDSGIHPSDIDETLIWFDSAHNKCSQLFKEMTKGELYEKFQ